ncbi:uncharacterized protein [Lepeophtheirus salmonis]|uniref:uncharacterized protein n=1 Tax=Lepeophtheirus salmonis TaxID=72036 RepID=UPI001AEBA483|nr:histidine-rich glycoprotein-like [Lepeophtheirus salmonis]
MTSKIIVLTIILGMTNFQSVSSDGAGHHHHHQHDDGASNTHNHDHGASNSHHNDHSATSNSHPTHSTEHSQSLYAAPSNQLNVNNEGPSSSYDSPVQTYNAPSASHAVHSSHQHTGYNAPTVSHHYQDESQKPDNSIIGFFRRLAGGFVALKGGLIKGHAAFWDSKGNALINVGKRIAGRPPYGPEYKPIEKRPVPYHPQH